MIKEVVIIEGTRLPVAKGGAEGATHPHSLEKYLCVFLENFCKRVGNAA